MTPTIYEVATIGTGKLSVMAMPNNGEEVAGLRQLGIDHVVSLLEVNEQFDVGLWEEEKICIENGMRYTSFPITDREVPQKADALALAAALKRDIADGDHLVIHCRAGIGRSGIIASAVLIQAGYSPGEAIHMVSWARGVLVPDTKEQNSWVKSLERVEYNPFNALCELASAEGWCWDLGCTTCGHLHFRYSFQELAEGKTPEDRDWAVSVHRRDYSELFGSWPSHYSGNQKEKVLGICVEANIKRIAARCKFPDWLGYLGLVLAHMNTVSDLYIEVSQSWASQLKQLVEFESPIWRLLDKISSDKVPLTLQNLESIESHLISHSEIIQSQS